MANLALQLRIAFRYSFGSSQSSMGRFISLMSGIGLVFGVALLIVVIAVMNGFDKELRERILVMVPHLQLINSEEHNRDNWYDQALEISGMQQVRTVEPFSQIDLLFKKRQAIEPGVVYALGVTAEYSRIVNPNLNAEDEIGAQQIIGKDLYDKLKDKNSLIMGAGLAANLGIADGDTTTLLVTDVRSKKMKAKQFKVAGIFKTRTEVDQRLAFVGFENFVKLPGQSDKPQGLRIQLQDMFEARYFGRALQQHLSANLRLTTWEQTHGNLFQAIQMSRYMVALIVLLILVIAAFNLVSTLMIATADKQSEIAILKTLGATPAHVTWVFTLQGLMIGSVGSVLGTVIGVLLTLNLTSITQFVEKALGSQLLNSEVYPLDYLPSDMLWHETFSVLILAISLSMLASLYPALRIAKCEISEVLRYG